MPALGFGKVDQVQQQARHNIALFEKAEVEFVITDCATCGSTLKDYGKLLADDPLWADRAAAFSKKVRDISEFLCPIPFEKPQDAWKDVSPTTILVTCGAGRAYGSSRAPCCK